MIKKAILTLFLIFFTILLIWGYNIYVAGNFHTVIEGELYRSAQPTPEQIKKYSEKYGIKTIINMRGRRPGKVWYEEEVKASTALGIQHYDWAFSSTLETPLSHMDHLLWIMKRAEKPILIHCMAGSDRTGMGVAIYMYGIKTWSPENSKAEGLKIRYGHFPYLWSKTTEIGRSFDKFTAANRKSRGLR